MAVLDRHTIRATVALNAEVCDCEPQIIRAGVARSCEWMGHGISNSVRIPGLGEQTALRAMREACRGPLFLVYTLPPIRTPIAPSGSGAPAPGGDA